MEGVAGGRPLRSRARCRAARAVTRSGPRSREAEPEQPKNLLRRVFAGGGQNVSLARVKHGLFFCQPKFQKINQMLVAGPFEEGGCMNKIFRKNVQICTIITTLANHNDGLMPPSPKKEEAVKVHGKRRFGMGVIRKFSRKFFSHHDHEIWAARDSILQHIDVLTAKCDALTAKCDALTAKSDRMEALIAHLARRNLIPCADVNLIRGVSGYLAVKNTDYAVQVVLQEAGELEPGTRKCIERLLCSGDTFVDVGANLGTLTLAAARAMHGKGRIVCFEPFSDTCALLRHTLFLNGFAEIATVHCAACFSQSGSHSFYIAETCGHNSLYPLAGSTNTGESIEVEMTTLDEALSGIPVTLLKIDAEGAEPAILHGAMQVLESNPDVGIIVEYGPEHLKRSGETQESFFMPFDKLGFVMRGIDDASGALYVMDRDTLHNRVSVNLFFARPNSMLWKRLENY